MVGDGGAVRLVADVLQHEQRLGAARDHAAGRDGPGSRPPRAASRARCAGSTGRARRGPRSPASAGPGRRRRRSSAGGYENRRRRSSGGASCSSSSRVNRRRSISLHRGEVVLARDARDLELPVVLALRAARPRTPPSSPPCRSVRGSRCRSTRSGAAPARARADRRARRAPATGAEVGGAAELVPLERVGGVARHDLQEPPLRPAGGHRDPHRAAAADRSSHASSSVGVRRAAWARAPAAGCRGAPCRAARGTRRPGRADRDPRRGRRPSRAGPSTRPRRTKKTWNAASRSSSASATTSRSSGGDRTISWDSSARRAANSWSRSFAACSNSWRSRRDAHLAPRDRGGPAARCPPGTPPSRRREAR